MGQLDDLISKYERETEAAAYEHEKAVADGNNNFIRSAFC